MQRNGYVIDPRSSGFPAVWDMVIVVALAFTAVVTPLEVAYLDKEGTSITVLWGFNRVVDAIFIFDIFVCFNVAFERNDGGHWVTNRQVIVRSYAYGWFPIDFVSCIPLWPLRLNWASPMEHDANGEPILRTAVAVRLLKLLRLMKLARILKASRVLRRHVDEVLLHGLQFTYGMIRVLQLIVILLLYMHWQACLWGVFSAYMKEVDYPNWISAFDASHEQTMGEAPTAFDRYAAALYFSTMTLTSIGYGEMLPQNTYERLLLTAMQLLSGLMWAYVIGSISTVLTTLDPNGVYFTNTMDSLNYFMRDRHLPWEMRVKLRVFFENSRYVRQREEDQALFTKMSPYLQSTVALEANRRWIRMIWFLRDIKSTRDAGLMVARLSRHLTICVYTQEERLPLGQLYILGRGIVVRNWRIFSMGRVWGEDIILDRKEFVDHAQAVALSYVETHTLRRHDLDVVLAEFPVQNAIVRKAVRKVSFQRCLLLHLLKLINKRDDPGGAKPVVPVSFVPASIARGYETVGETRSMESWLRDEMAAMKREGRRREERLSAQIDQLRATLALTAEHQARSAGWFASSSALKA